MTKTQVKQLRAGDEVFWTDPDDDICSRIYKIRHIEVYDMDEDDPIVCISDVDGSDLECFASELS